MNCVFGRLASVSFSCSHMSMETDEELLRLLRLRHGERYCSKPFHIHCQQREYPRNSISFCFSTWKVFMHRRKITVKWWNIRHKGARTTREMTCILYVVHDRTTITEDIIREKTPIFIGEWHNSE
ncbi:hypothetical protein Y032_0111g207 [Ancylostoma ceylanicum]|nr:hypothetical protein Y032_0111g207 [Ancylostoma ceylanicum]